MGSRGSEVGLKKRLLQNTPGPEGTGLPSKLYHHIIHQMRICIRDSVYTSTMHGEWQAQSQSLLFMRPVGLVRVSVLKDHIFASSWSSIRLSMDSVQRSCQPRIVLRAQSTVSPAPTARYIEAVLHHQIMSYVCSVLIKSLDEIKNFRAPEIPDPNMNPFCQKFWCLSIQALEPRTRGQYSEAWAEMESILGRTAFHKVGQVVRFDGADCAKQRPCVAPFFCRFIG